MIALTAGALLEEKRLTVPSAGMNDFLTKPLRAEPAYQPRAGRRRAIPWQTIPIESTLQDAAPTFNPWPDIAGIDQKTAERLMLGNLRPHLRPRFLAPIGDRPHPAPPLDRRRHRGSGVAANGGRKRSTSYAEARELRRRNSTSSMRHASRTRSTHLKANPLEALAALHAELEKLRIASQPTLTAIKNQQSTTTIADNKRIPLDDTSLAELNRLLTQHDLEALREQIEKWADPLRAFWRRDLHTTPYTNNGAKFQ